MYSIRYPQPDSIKCLLNFESKSSIRLESSDYNLPYIFSRFEDLVFDQDLITILKESILCTYRWMSHSMKQRFKYRRYL